MWDKFSFPIQVLAKKMTVLYKLAREQLSKQSHYDFGLRALKSVLVMAGELKRGSPDLSEVETMRPLLCSISLNVFMFKGDIYLAPPNAVIVLKSKHFKHLKFPKKGHV